MSSNSSTVYSLFFSVIRNCGWHYLIGVVYPARRGFVLVSLTHTVTLVA